MSSMVVSILRFLELVSFVPGHVCSFPFLLCFCACLDWGFGVLVVESTLSCVVQSFCPGVLLASDCSVQCCFHNVPTLFFRQVLLASLPELRYVPIPSRR